jgi:hypothetical protein
MITVGVVQLGVTTFDGWNYPTFGSTVPILHDGTSVDNEVLQSGSVLRLRATVRGRTLDFQEIEVLRGYNASKEMVDFVDSELGDSYTVVVLDFQYDRAIPFLFAYTIDLIDMSDQAGSGSGS